MDSLMLHSDSYLQEENKIQYGSESIKDELLDDFPRTDKLPNEKSPITGLSPTRSRRTEPNPDNINLNHGHWSTEENKRYHWFLEIHYQHFLNRHMRRMDKIFKSMEHFVGSRQAEQCRSHHQKMEKKYITFPSIVANLRRKHYGSLEEGILIEDMQAHGIDYGDGIATLQQLEYESKTFKPPSVHHRKKGGHYRKRLEPAEEYHCSALKPAPEVKEEEGHLQHHENNEGSEVPNAHHLLEESNMHMGEMMLYHDHEKDDISCLFNNYPQPIPDHEDDNPQNVAVQESEQNLLNMSQ